jgi:hypothetical protein
MVFGVSPSTIQQPVFPQVTPALGNTTGTNFNPGAVFVPVSSAASMPNNAAVTNFGTGNAATIAQLVASIQGIVATLGQLLPMLGNVGGGNPVGLTPSPVNIGNVQGSPINTAPAQVGTAVNPSLPFGNPLGGNIFGQGGSAPVNSGLGIPQQTGISLVGAPATAAPNQQQLLGLLQGVVRPVNNGIGNFTTIRADVALKDLPVEARMLISNESQAVLSDNHFGGNLLLKGGINNFAANVVGKTEEAVRQGLGLPAGAAIPGGLTMNALQQAAVGLSQQDNNNIAVRDAKRIVQLSMAEGQATGTISGKLHLTAVMDSFDKLANIQRGAPNSFVARYQNEINNLPPPSAGRPLAQAVTAKVGSPEQVAQLKQITGLNDAELSAYIQWNHSGAFLGKISDSMLAMTAASPNSLGDNGFTTGNTQLLALALADDGQIEGPGGIRNALKPAFDNTLDRLMGRNVAAFDVGAAIKQTQARSGITDNQILTLVNQTKNAVLSGVGGGVTQAFRNIAEDPAKAIGMPAIASALSGVCPFLAGSVSSAKNLLQ